MAEGKVIQQSGIVTRLNQVDGWLGNRRLSRFLFAEPKVDTATFLKNTHAKKKGEWFQNILKKVLSQKTQTRLGHFLAWFDRLPGMGRLSHWVRSNFVFDLAFRGIGVVKDTAQGAVKTEGGPIARLIGGIKSGVKSAIKSVGAFAASVGAAVALPLLLRVPFTGPVGIIGGTIASLVVGGGVGKLLDALWDTHGHTKKKDEEADPVPESPSSIANEIERMSKERDDLKPFMKGENPWLSPNGFSSLEKELAKADKMVEDAYGY